MDFETVANWFTLENVMDLIRKYRSFGPVPGILLPMLEAFFPFLPLFLFVMANASAFGLWLGFLFSWIGAVTGALLVFGFVRKYGQRRILRFLKNHSKVSKLMNWLERHGFGPLFLMLCFPFTPSALVNIVAGLSNIKKHQYFIAVMAGKMVMIFTISFIGHDVVSLIRKPLRTVIVAIVIFILWLAGKWLELQFNEKEHKKEKQPGK
ncbi:MAG: TVP38/TMEM64 family protein [Bacillales bacterium]|nr:TVP38/TMEM64 family protein [Bacillales bacterium]